jgi:hypothetical protein
MALAATPKQELPTRREFCFCKPEQANKWLSYAQTTYQLIDSTPYMYLY